MENKLQIPHTQSGALSRNMFADYIKGILIFLVIFVHLIQHTKYGDARFWDNTLIRYIYTFQMPLFMAICGYYTFFSLQKRSAFSFIKNRFVSLLPPLITWGITMAFAGISAKPRDMSLLHYIYINITQSYWFVWAVLVHSTIAGIVKLLKMDNKYVVIAIGIIGMLIPLFFTNNVVLAYTKDMFPFFIVGYLLANTNIERLCQFCRKYFIIFLIISIVSLYYWPSDGFIYFTPSDIYHLEIALFRFFIGIVMSVVSLIAVYEVYLKIEKSKLVEYLSLLGQKTLEIYLVQGIIFFAFYSNIRMEGLERVPSILYLIPSVLIIALIYLFIVTVEKYKPAGSILFGKR